LLHGERAGVQVANSVCGFFGGSTGSQTMRAHKSPLDGAFHRLVQREVMVTDRLRPEGLAGGLALAFLACPL